MLSINLIHTCNMIGHFPGEEEEERKEKRIWRRKQGEKKDGRRGRLGSKGRDGKGELDGRSLRQKESK